MEENWISIQVHVLHHVPYADFSTGKRLVCGERFEIVKCQVEPPKGRTD